MRVVHLTWTLGVGGAEEMLIDIVNRQCLTASVWIIVVNDVFNQEVCARINPAVKQLWIGRKPGSRGLLPLARLNWLLHRVRPNVIHVHTWTLVKLLPFRPCKVALTVHTTADVEAFDESVRRYDKIFAISEAVAECIRHKVKRIRPLVIVNGIRAADILFERGRQDKAFRVVQVSRLEHNCKGQDILLRAIAFLRDRAEIDGISVEFIGDGTSKPLLEELVRTLSLESLVTFRGTVPRNELYTELHTYDLLIQPSRYEGFGLAVVEAMVAGVPVLVSDLKGPSEIIEDGRLGFLFRSGDYIDCANSIQRIRQMKANAALTLRRCSEAARQHALERFDVNRTADEYLLAYRDALGAGSRVNSLAISESV